MKLLAEWFWTDRWDGSSAALLPLEARGLYREMLSQAWRRGGRLPNDPEAIQRAVRCTSEEWARCWPKVKRYWRVDGDELVNDTQLEIYGQAMALQGVRQAGGRARVAAAARDDAGRLKPAEPPARGPAGLPAEGPAGPPARAPALSPAGAPAGHQQEVQPLSPSLSPSLSPNSVTEKQTQTALAPTGAPAVSVPADAGKNGHGHPIPGDAGSLLRYFDALHRKILNAPYMCHPARDQKALRPPLQVYKLNGTRKLMRQYWLEFKQAQNEPDPKLRSFVGRSRPDIPGFVAQIPNLLRDYDMGEGA